MKGGVGKTTLTVSLAESLAVMGKKRVLVIDLDAQASCTFALVGRERMLQLTQNQKHTGALFRKLHERIRHVESTQDFAPLTATAEPIGRDLAFQPIGIGGMIERHATSIIAAEEVRLDLIAAVPQLQKIERDILYELGRKSRQQENPDARVSQFFDEAVKPIRVRYDFIIVDCPPGISSFSAAAVHSADLVLSPVMPEYLSEMGLSVFAESILRPHRHAGRLPRPARVIFNRVQSSKAHNEYRESIGRLVKQKDDVLRLAKTIVPQDQALSDISSAGDIQQDIRSKYDTSIPILEDLVREVLDVTGA